MKIFAPVIISMLLLGSCGKNHHHHGGKKSAQAPKPETSRPEEGEYRALLSPLNAEAGQHKTYGTMLLTIGENFDVKITSLSGPSTNHTQGIYTGIHCPDATHDINKDGFIDIIEGQKAFGNMLIPLDGDLSTQEAGANDFPTGSSYTYSKIAKVADLLNDLWASDLDSNDFTVKLMPGRPIALEGKTVVIWGVSNKLPESVATIQNNLNESTLPIACGRIVRIPAE